MVEKEMMDRLHKRWNKTFSVRMCPANELQVGVCRCYVMIISIHFSGVRMVRGKARFDYLYLCLQTFTLGQEHLLVVCSLMSLSP